MDGIKVIVTGKGEKSTMRIIYPEKTTDKELAYLERASYETAVKMGIQPPPWTIGEWLLILTLFGGFAFTLLLKIL